MNKIERGDIVRLKSGGPNMTVVLIDNTRKDSVITGWFDFTETGFSGEYNTATFSKASLIKVETTDV